MDKKDTRFIEIIWEFIRGDLEIESFEKWLYSLNDSEIIFGEDLNFNLISIDYKVSESVYLVKKQLKKFAVTNFPQKCHCLELSDTSVIDMGGESERIFHTINEVSKRGGKYWWLSIKQCRVCNQLWLVASEERQNDVYCMQRVSGESLEKILKDNHWPPFFETYESLLRLGYDAGKSVRFLDPLESSLSYTITDLALEKPGIKITEIAKLLNLELRLATELSRLAVKKNKIIIQFNNEE